MEEERLAEEGLEVYEHVRINGDVMVMWNCIDSRNVYKIYISTEQHASHIPL